MPANDHLQRVTLLLVGVSTTLIQVALDTRDPGAGLSLLVVSIAAAAVLWWFMRSRQATEWTAKVVASVLAVALLPVVWDLVTRALVGVGNPYEVQLAYVLRNAMLALAVTPRLPRATSYAALASFFLTVFGYLWSVGMGAVILLVVYALIGTWWLLAAYWDRLGGRFADSSQSNLPVRPAVATLVGLLLASGLLIPLAGRSAVTTALAGFFPSSGGTQWSDPFAHGGVGDGDQMVAAKEQASSFGPIDSELFLESKMPSLYDAFNEFSEATPIKNKKRARRAIPLAPSQMKMNHQKTGTTQRSSREFSTVRQKTAERRNQEDRLSASLLLVKGRTPLHLALETYDRWDGRSLIASESPAEVATTLAAPNSKKLRWLNFSVSHPAAAFTADALSQVRVVNLKTDRVPTPAGTTGVTMTGLHAATMFKPARDGSLAMDVEHVPQLTVFEFRSALRDRSIDPELARSGSATDGGRIAGLAARWTDGVAPGWSQVETIIARLRSGYEHDRNAMVPADVEDAVEHFLFESRSGPDYLFAASTAVMLRSLGYDTRVRSGFYADPNRFDYKSRLTSVLAEDAHFWVEVRTLNGRRLTKNGKKLPGVWVTVEPTPGYRVLYAPESMLAWLQRNVQVCLAAVLARPVTSIAAVCFLAFVIASRRSLLDGLLIAWWSIRSRTAEVGSLARLTLRLIEWRAWAYRRCRPTGTTLGRWAELESHNDFVALASWALYGAGSAPLTTASARAACRRAVRTRFTKQDTAPIEPTAA